MRLSIWGAKATLKAGTSQSTMSAAFAKDDAANWARRVKLAQWALRAPPRADRDGRSPYELVTGMKPQGPLNRVFEKVSDRTLAASEYVRDLGKHTKRIQEGVATCIPADFARKRAKGEKSSSSSWALPWETLSSSAGRLRPCELALTKSELVWTG